MPSRPLWAAISLGCILGVAALSQPPKKETTGEHEAPLLPRKELLHVLGASNQQLVADYFWIQTIQAVGKARSSEEYLDVYYYADLVTDLDPTFMTIYAFAGAAIPVNLGRETWVNTAESTRILEKGVRFASNDVYLRILLAYNYSYFHKEYHRAAAILERTAKMPGAPSYLGALATRLYAQSGDIDAGMALAQTLYEGAKDPQTQNTFEQRIKQLELERALRQVDSAIELYSQRKGRPPTKMEELLANGDLSEVPSDPLGGELVIGADGRSQSTALARRLWVYEPRKED